MPLLYCHKCEQMIFQPLLKNETKKAVLLAVRNNQSLVAIKLVKDTGQLDLKAAQCFADHICKIKGQCCHCHSVLLKEELTICPVCKGFNFNWPDEVVY